jgi:hypothetical protein
MQATTRSGISLLNEKSVLVLGAVGVGVVLFTNEKGRESRIIDDPRIVRNAGQDDARTTRGLLWPSSDSVHHASQTRPGEHPD